MTDPVGSQVKLPDTSSARAICPDCNRWVQTRTNGRCLHCGSQTLIPRAHQSPEFKEAVWS